MKTLSIPSVVPASKSKWRIVMTPLISIRKRLRPATTAIPGNNQDSGIARPSPSVDYYLLALTGLYLIILIVGCWVVVQTFWQWTTDNNFKWFQLLNR